MLAIALMAGTGVVLADLAIRMKQTKKDLDVLRNTPGGYALGHARRDAT